jgi:hypothetical protein
VTWEPDGVGNNGWEVTTASHMRTGGLSETTVEKWPNPVAWEPADYQKQRLSNDKSSHVRTGGHREQRWRSSLIQARENRGISETTVEKWPNPVTWEPADYQKRRLQNYRGVLPKWSGKWRLSSAVSSNRSTPNKQCWTPVIWAGTWWLRTCGY